MRGDTDIRLLFDRWCEQPSGTDDRAGLARMRALLADELQTLPGDLVEVPIDGYEPALSLACRPQAPIQVLLSGHYDTVYGPESAFRTVDEIAPGVLRGPGVADMKGGLIVMLLALEDYERDRPSDHVGWRVLITPDEEIGSLGSRHLLAAVASEFDVGLVFEPAQPGGTLVRNRKGTGGFEIAIAGRSAHAGRERGEGRNAVVALGDLVIRLDALNGEPGLQVTVSSAAGGGPLNVVPADAHCGVDVRADDAAIAERAPSLIADVADAVARAHDVRVSVSGQMNRPPMLVDPARQRLFDLYRACGQELGVSIDWVDSGGGSDGSLLAAAGLCVLDSVGVRGGALHSPDEHCELASVRERAEICACLLRRLATGGMPG